MKLSPALGLILVYMVSFMGVSNAQSPANLNADINASSGFSSVGAIEATYNHARRQEENQLNLGTNAIANLDLPSQNVWNTYSDDKKALYILNDERVSRSGINYGQGSVRGYPFEGITQKIDDVSQAYAQVLMDNDAFTHSFGNSPSTRIINGVGLSCREFTSRSENLYGAVASSNSGFPNVVAKAMYGFIYDDAGSNWGHREMCLLQDKDLSGNPWGFSDNHGASQEEGFIGIGIVRGTNWSAFGSNWPYGVVLVMNYFDPVSSGCNFNILESTSGTSSPGVDNSGDDCPALLSFANEDVDGIHKSSNEITVANGTQITGPTVFSAPEIEIAGTFEVLAGNCLEFSDEGCQYDGIINCDPPVNPGSGAGTCADPFSMVCGTILQGNTNQFSNIWSSYGASGGWSGPEVVFTIEQPARSIVTITLDQLQADLDLIIISSCTNSPLVASTNSGTSSEVISISAVSTTRTLHVVVEGYSGAVSSYRMSLTCPSNLRDNTTNLEQKSTVQISKKETTLSRVCEPYIEER